MPASPACDARNPLPPRLQECLERHPDFAALQTTMRRMQGIVGNDNAKLQTVAEAVVDDPALTSRLLRLIHAAHYRGSVGSGITSVQRAVSVMGMDTVRNMALSLRLLDRLPTDRRGRILREDFLRALMAARLARELCPDPRLMEEAYITALFQNLGRMLVAAHLPDDALAVRDAVPRQTWPLAPAEDEAAHQQLGLAYSATGAWVAQSWGWPSPLCSAMSPADWPKHAANGEGSLRCLGWVANALADLLVHADPARWPEGCERLAEQASAATGQGSRDWLKAMATARDELSTVADIVGLPLCQEADWHRSDAVNGRVLPSPLSPTASAHAPRKVREGQGAAHLNDEALRLSEALLDEATRRTVPPQALQAVHDGLGARRAVLFLSRPGQSVLRAIKVVGEPLLAMPGQPAWLVDPQGKDLFARLLGRGQDTLIHDAQKPEVKAHLPAAHACAGETQAFLVMPLVAAGRVLGMMYVDGSAQQPLRLDESHLAGLRALRNQTLMALMNLG